MSKTNAVATKSEATALTSAVQEGELNTVDSRGQVPAFRMVKAVTRPVLKFGASPEYVRIESAMYKGEKLAKAKYDSVPTLMEVVNLRTGEAALIVVAKVLEQELNGAYPDQSYVGKDFQIRKIKTDDKNYALWSVAEIMLT